MLRATPRREGALALLAALPEATALLEADGSVLGINEALRGLLGPALPAGRGADPAGWFQQGWPAREGESEVTLATGARLRASLAPLGMQGLRLLRLSPAGVASDRLELLGRMAGGIAHDFNNVLGIVTAASAAARLAEDSLARLAELRAIEEAADRGTALVRQLLAFSRQQVMAPRVLDLNERVGQMARLLARLLGAGIRLELELDDPPRRVRADPSQLDQVLLNLAVNARDAMEGRGLLRIETGSRLVLGEGAGCIPPGRYATITVQDSGPGIPPEVLARIFEPFFTTRIEKGGTGLGLATVQGIVAQSGGHILAESPPGQGARFTILLPRHEGEAEAAPAPEPVAAQAGPAHILLVDDEPALLRLATQALERAGHRVTTAEDGQDALEQLQDGLSPDLLVTDVAMPGLDGVELASGATALILGLPVLLLSGYAASTLSVDLRQKGWGFLAKPWTADSLCAAVAKALDKRG
jgi:two-component system cell cycle sensor histidine kinase/response regulator CckA